MIVALKTSNMPTYVISSVFRNIHRIINIYRLTIHFKLSWQSTLAHPLSSSYTLTSNGMPQRLGRGVEPQGTLAVGVALGKGNIMSIIKYHKI